MEHVVSALVVTIAIVLVIRWIVLRVTEKGRQMRAWAAKLRPKEKAEREARAGKTTMPDPAPSKIAAKVGAGFGGAVQGAVLAWKAGWPGFQLGWDRGRSWMNDRWLNRLQPPTDTGTDEPDLTRCPECGYDLAENNWPAEHKNPATRKPCDYDWSTDDRWKNCPNCGGLYPPGIDMCGDCGHRVATGPTRWDKVAEQADAAADPGPRTTHETQSAPVDTEPKGTPPMPITETGPAEIRNVADLRAAAVANHRQAQADLEDTTAAVTRAQVAYKYAQAIADAAPLILDNDPAAAAAQTAQIEPAAADLRAAQARRASAEARLNTAAAALRALQAHRQMEEAKANVGGRASSRTDAYANN
jgi:hypothetical protein